MALPRVTACVRRQRLDLRGRERSHRPGIVSGFGHYLQVTEVILEVAAGRDLVLDVYRPSIVLRNERLGCRGHKEKSRRGEPKSDHRDKCNGRALRQEYSLWLPSALTFTDMMNHRFLPPRKSPLLLVAAITLACGPELTDRAETDLTGVWVGIGKVVTITDIRVEIIQEEDARLRGSWTGKAPLPLPTCPPGLNTTPGNVIFGSNSIAQVEFQLLGAGQFNGALVSPTRIEGRVRSCGKFYRLDFEFLTPEVPGLDRTKHQEATAR